MVLIQLAKYITLDPIEELMITYHMGIYGCFEFEGYAAEYRIVGLKTDKDGHQLSKEDRRGKSMRNAWFHNPITKLMYICDELEAFTIT